MKNIPLRTHTTEKNNGKFIDTVFLIKAVLETPPPGGFAGTSEMRNRFKVLDKLETLHADTTILDLEDDQAKTLAAAATQMKWAKLDKFIIDFEDSLK